MTDGGIYHSERKQEPHHSNRSADFLRALNFASRAMASLEHHSFQQD
jgi:hypothetical protein